MTLDLTGLPPTQGEIAAFLNDDSPDAYEEAVDRLLATTAYGERMAVAWLDGARYADSSGYQTDAERSMWRYRDWVIDAYNANMPFDQFTIEQLAGDMLPDATLDQRIASAFNRNHSQNGEGGIIPEEFLVENVVDRVSTTSTVWLGLTLGCARCHDHKFDPISQEEFYEVFAHFNNVSERGKAFKYGNSPPMVTAPTADQFTALAEFDEKLAEAREAFASLETETAAAQREWEDSLPAAGRARLGPARQAPRPSSARRRRCGHLYRRADHRLSPGHRRGTGAQGAGDRRSAGDRRLEGRPAPLRARTGR